MLIYGSATMGTTVYIHYCMNELVGWSLLNDKDGTCGKCGMAEENKGGCCKDERKHFKLKVDQQKAKVSHLIALNIFPALLVPIVDFDIHSCSNITKTYPTSHAPPGVIRQPLHILHGVFLI